jgi:hypothetical protein
LAQSRVDHLDQVVDAVFTQCARHARNPALGSRCALRSPPRSSGRSTGSRRIGSHTLWRDGPLPRGRKECFSRGVRERLGFFPCAHDVHVAAKSRTVDPNSHCQKLSEVVCRFSRWLSKCREQTCREQKLREPNGCR